MINQYELNDRISIESDKQLFIFRNHIDLKIYQRIMGINKNIYYATEKDLENRNYLVGKRYYNWHYFSDYDINLLKAENRKNKKIFEKIDNDLICQEVSLIE